MSILKEYNVATDGAYFKNYRLVTWGAVIYDGSMLNKIHEFTNMSSEVEHILYAQVFGELQAVMDAINFIRANAPIGAVINIHYDYEGIRSWALNYWKSNNNVTTRYKLFMEELLDNPTYKVNFIKTQAHKSINKEVHDLIQVKEISPGIMEYNNELRINITTTDPRIIKFFKELPTNDLP